MSKLGNFFQTKKGNAVLVIGMSIIGIVVIYFVFFTDEEKQKVDIVNKKAGVDVGVKDSIIKKKPNVYYRNGDTGKKEINNENDFFAAETKIESTTKQLKKVLDSVDKLPPTQTDYQRIVDSLKLELEKKKINKHQPVKKTRVSKPKRRASKPKPKTEDSREVRSAWIERMNRENEDFYNTPITKKGTEKAGENDLYSDKEIFAVVYRNQEVINKGRISLRLSNDVVIKGVRFERNTIFYGFVGFSKNRIYINVNSINDIKVNLVAFDAQDNGEGIYTEKKFENTVNSQLKNSAIDEVNVSSVPLGNTIKSIVKRKKRIDKIELLNEYKLTLKMK